MYVIILNFIDILVLEIFDLKNADFVSLLATGAAMETIFCSIRWGGVFLTLATTQY